MYGAGPPALGARLPAQEAGPPVQGVGPPMQGVRPLAPTTIPRLDRAEPDFESELKRESLYETTQLVTQLKALYKKYNSNILK